MIDTRDRGPFLYGGWRSLTVEGVEWSGEALRRREFSTVRIRWSQDVTHGPMSRSQNHPKNSDASSLGRMFGSAERDSRLLLSDQLTQNVEDLLPTIFDPRWLLSYPIRRCTVAGLDVESPGEEVGFPFFHPLTEFR